MLKLLGMGWTVWSVAKNRFGAVGGLVVALLAVGGYVLVTQWLEQRYPSLAETIE